MSNAEKAGWSALLQRRAEGHKARVHLTTMYRLIRQGRIPAFRVGGRWRLNVEDIELWSQHGGPDD